MVLGSIEGRGAILEEEGERSGAFLARRALTMKRLERHPRWFCAPGTEDGMKPDDLLCSRNARPQKALVGRAQWKINQPPSLKRSRASLEREGSGQVPFLLAEPPR
jgi:hypothetical protein